MGYCAPRGIPLSQFLSWSQDDQDAALAWAGHESRRCRSCGHHPDDGPTAHAHVDVCPGCVATDHTSNTDDAKVRGAHVRMIPGTAKECDRCALESAANQLRGG